MSQTSGLDLMLAGRRSGTGQFLIKDVPMGIIKSIVMRMFGQPRSRLARLSGDVVAP
jgi:hypothetical protein